MFRHPPLAPGWIDAEHRRLELGPLGLESGQTIEDAFVSYVVHGDPGRLRDEAVLVVTAIGSTHHRLDFLIGPGAALDTDRHAVVVVDALGNGLSVSPSNSAAQPGADFPRFSIRDMVESQRQLVDRLGIGRIAAVVGASMGGMQALQWAVSHPERMHRVVAMTPMARTSRWSQLVNELARRALFVDAACRLPRPRDEAMRLWAPLTQLVIAQTPEALEAFATLDELPSWIDGKSRALADDGPDAFDWCRQSWAYDSHDVGTTTGFGGDTLAALASIRVPTLVLAPALDLYNPAFSARAASDAIAAARFVELPGCDGHRSASGTGAESTAALRRAVADFLAP
ncbi:MAG: alpha/beta fold hydrolase [Caldimonas sp.]